MTTVVNVFKDQYDVYIGRAGKGHDGYYGNPVKLIGDDRIGCLNGYRVYFNDRIAKDEVFRARIEGLRDKRLGCFCYPKLCHGMVIVEYLDGVTVEEQMAQIEKGVDSTPSLWDTTED